MFVIVSYNRFFQSVDIGSYIQKKSLAQGMMDLALVSANTNQLRYIIEYKEHHPYFMTSLSLVIASLFLQLAVGMTLIWNTRYSKMFRKLVSLRYVFLITKLQVQRKKTKRDARS